MSINVDARTIAAGATEFEPEEALELEVIWVEQVVVAVGVAITVLFVSSIAVLMVMA